MKNVVVTGGSGKAGRAVVRDLVDHGYRVLNVDAVPPRDKVCPFLKVDLEDFGQAVDALKVAAGVIDRLRPFAMADAVVHLAAIPDQGLVPEAVTYRTNMLAAHNIFSAATLLGVPRVVWASSETVHGVPFFRIPPDFAPVTEMHPLRAETGYALTKVLGEEEIRHMARWNRQTSFAALRICHVNDEDDYRAFPALARDPQDRKASLWAYVDSRDVAQACRLALEANIEGADSFIISAADTAKEIPAKDLLAEIYPGVALTRAIGAHETLFDSGKAKRLLGYEPKHSWRRYV
jgi:nucleoside-diphosphate-sugar epimerase